MLFSFMLQRETCSSDRVLESEMLCFFKINHIPRKDSRSNHLIMALGTGSDLWGSTQRVWVLLPRSRQKGHGKMLTALWLTPKSYHLWSGIHRWFLGVGRPEEEAKRNKGDKRQRLPPSCSSLMLTVNKVNNSLKYNEKFQKWTW